VPVTASFSSLLRILNEACYGSLPKGADPRRWKLQATETTTIPQDDGTHLSVTTQTWAGLFLHLQHAPSISPAPLYDAGVTEHAEEVRQKILQAVHGGDLVLSAARALDSDAAFSTVLARQPLNERAAFELATKLLTAKLTLDVGSAAMREALQFEAVHGLWELCSLDNQAVGAMCKVRHSTGVL
jgi:hypothetical protein